MISSTILSSSDHKKVEKILQNFLEGNYSCSEIASLLEEYVTINFDAASEWREIGKNLLDGVFQIPVEDHYLANMLQKYISGEVSNDELSDWAAFIFLSQVYVPKGKTEEERWLAGEGPTWDILQKLITPSVFGGLDKNVAQKYTDELEQSLST
jgi:hypothetical protein